MGTHHTFEDLNNPYVGKKLFKFKQMRLMKMEKGGNRVSPDHEIIADKGACAAYTMLWCREQSAPGIFSFDRDGTYTGSLKGGRSQAVTLGIQLHAYKRGFLGDTYHPDDGMVNLGRSVGLGVGPSKRYDDLHAALQDIQKVPGTLYVAEIQCIETKGAVTWHAVGVNMLQNRDLILFDPNCGEYQVFDAMNFVLYLEGSYQKTDMDRFGECHVYKIRT